jgi:hypothetical protein
MRHHDVKQAGGADVKSGAVPVGFTGAGFGRLEEAVTKEDNEKKKHEQA